MAKLVSKTYGEALFEIAVEENKAKEFMEEVVAIEKIIAENPEFDKLMKHPGIPKQEKVDMIETVFGGRVSLEIVNFLKIIITKERYKELQKIFEYFTLKVKEKNKIGIVFVTTAMELTQTQKEAVEQKIIDTTSYLSLETTYEIDSSIIGGMIIRINDRVVDSSVRTKLNDLTKQLLNIQLS